MVDQTFDAAARFLVNALAQGVGWSSGHPILRGKEMREVRVPMDPQIDRLGRSIPVNRVVTVDHLDRDYRNAPGTREQARRLRQRERKNA